ncbi:MAG: hypothetical protein H7Z72_03545 [Bacteroidetes bacterium]|nr:hypothetical protein [Fibrella sp.]
MSVQEYKQRLHEVIDAANDEAALRELLDTANRMLGRDILDDLSDEQLGRIDSSMNQIKQGRIVSSSQVKEEAMQWLKKK